MKKAIGISLALFVAMGIAAVALLTTFSGAASASARATGPGGDITTGAPVPGWVRVLVDQQAGKCPQVTASLLAAQLFIESGFNPKAHSPAGALGIAQFLPSTWAVYGMDGDGDGVRNVLDPADAVAAQASYDCVLAAAVRNVAGDSSDNMLAAYNAGSGAVIMYGGVPPFPETRSYVENIRTLASKWAVAINPGVPADGGAARAVAAAETALGSWYRFGGDCVAPFEGQGGCDCSSLTKMAWAAAGVNLPRVTFDQVHSGTAVQSVSQLQPGDLLFTIPTPAGPDHVGMYVGNDQVIEAPHTGAQVRTTPLSYWAPRVIAMRHIG